MNSQDRKSLNLWAALVVTVLAAGLVLTAHPAHAISSDILDAAILATVKIEIISPDKKDSNKIDLQGTCSGTVVSPDGLILTAFHCVGHSDLYGADASGLGLKDGDFYFPPGRVLIAPTLDAEKEPEATYVAQYLAGSTLLDVAVVKIDRMFADDPTLPNPLPLYPIVLGDSTKMKMGDHVGILGYPGVGGDLITFTDGEIAGFESQAGNGKIDSFKTTANSSPGNSGGLAIDDNGEQIGIPNYHVSEGADKISRIKMLSVALPFLDKARQAEGNNGNNSGSNNPLPPVAQGVVVQGVIVDADTQRGIPGAIFFLLNPGVTYSAYQAAGYDDSMVAAQGVADQDGTFLTAPPVARDNSYAVVVGAKNYYDAYADDGLDLAASGPGVFKWDEPLSLQKE